MKPLAQQCGKRHCGSQSKMIPIFLLPDHTKILSTLTHFRDNLDTVSTAFQAINKPGGFGTPSGGGGKPPQRQTRLSRVVRITKRRRRFLEAVWFLLTLLSSCCSTEGCFGTSLLMSGFQSAAAAAGLLLSC